MHHLVNLALLAAFHLVTQPHAEHVQLAIGAAAARAGKTHAQQARFQQLLGHLTYFPAKLVHLVSGAQVLLQILPSTSAILLAIIAQQAHSLAQSSPANLAATALQSALRQIVTPTALAPALFTTTAQLAQPPQSPALQVEMETPTPSLRPSVSVCASLASTAPFSPPPDSALAATRHLLAQCPLLTAGRPCCTAQPHPLFPMPLASRALPF